MVHGRHPSRWLLAALLAVCAPAWAQRHSFKFYGEGEGLRNLAVQVVVQDQTGYLWVGTQNGLFRYDGSRFFEFSKNDGLPGARIESLHTAGDGTLWVGTRIGLARRVKDHFETVDLGVAQGIVGRQAITTDAAGNLYLATDNGLVRGSLKKGKLQFQVLDPKADEIRSVFIDSSGRVWYGCGGSLCVLDKDSPRDVGKELGLPLDRWFAILGNVDGDLVVRGEHNIYRKRPGAARFETLPKLPSATNTAPTAALDPDGRLLVPTDQGLSRETASGWEIIDVEDGVSSDNIAAVLVDHEGSIWLGLTGSGLARWLGYDEWQSWTQREGLGIPAVRSSVWSITQTGDRRLWVGTRFELDYADVGDEAGKKLVWRKQALRDVEWPRAVAAAADGKLWIAGDKDGIVQLDPRSGQTRKFALGEGLGSVALHAMVDREQRVWVSTREGLYRAPRAASDAVFTKLKPAGTTDGEGFVCAVEDSQGQVWVCGSQGLVRYRGDDSRRFTTKDGLKANGVGQVAPAPDGSVWIGYRDAFGLTHLNVRSETPHVEHVTVESGLRSDKTLFLSFDTKGRLWAGTDHGVDVFDQTRWRHFGRAEGLIWDDCNTQAFLATEEGVWIGTSRGLSRYQARPMPAPAVPPTPVLTSISFGDKPWNGSATEEVSYKRNHLNLQLAALTFVQDSEVTFYIDLDGQVQVQRGTDVTFASLSSGPHVIQVMAQNAQGMWSVAPARMEFRISTPWYLTGWFRWGCFIAMLILGRVTWQRRTYRLERAVLLRTRELSVEKARAEHETSVVQEQKVEIERLLVEAQQASKLKSEFLANMSHEIRTPMNGVLGMTDLVLSTELRPDQREYLESARHAADSLLVILNDILDFSKIEAGRLDLNPVEFSLRDCLENTNKMFALQVSAKRLEYSAWVEPGATDRLVGDPDRLRQVLLNLVGNAVKFTHAGSISIRVMRETETAGWTTLRFEVRDTGIGIAADKCGVIFESFRQADGSMTRKYGGTGLGLAICARLVDLMGGKIWVESELDKGSKFIFTARFGVAAESSAGLENMARAVGVAEAPAVPSEKPASILRVLLAEDNAINQRLATRLLERRGHNVSVIGTGREAMAMLEQAHFDVVLMDVQMPDMDGLQATALIREREGRLGLHTPIIALTAHTMKGDRERCLEAGMDAYITKPVNAVELIAVVEATAAQFAADNA
jgi:signal transduction histidine kinase/ligand-binding sensor domain-containing protein/CheY-like chemotaxis protein